MERVTVKDLEQVCTNLNRRLEAAGSESRVGFEGRYGYIGIDEYRGDPDCTLNLPDSIPGRGAGWLAQRTLTTGHTKREAYDAMWNMIRALDLLPQEVYA